MTRQVEALKFESLLNEFPRSISIRDKQLVKHVYDHMKNWDDKRASRIAELEARVKTLKFKIEMLEVEKKYWSNEAVERMDRNGL